MLLAVFGLVLMSNPMHRRLHAAARKQWKEQAITRLAAYSQDTQALSNEIAVVRARPSEDMHDDWIGTNVLLFTNGEHFVYAHIDSKQDSRIHDLFIARGSDGKWYYSTFHFCIDMITVRGEILGKPAHGSLAEFAATYHLREFDGRSDECLQQTWPVKK